MSRVATVSGCQFECGDPAGGRGGLGVRDRLRHRPRTCESVNHDVQGVVGGAQPLQRSVGTLDGLKADQRVPRHVQCDRGAVCLAASSALRSDRLDVGGDGRTRRGDRRALRTTPAVQSTDHLHQPRHRATGQHQRTRLPRGEVLRRRPDSGRAGQGEHVGARRPDHQGVAQPHRGDGHRGDDGNAQPGHLGGPGAHRDGGRQCHGDHGQLRATVQVGPIGAEPGGERAEGGDQPGSDVARRPCRRRRGSRCSRLRAPRWATAGSSEPGGPEPRQLSTERPQAAGDAGQVDEPEHESRRTTGSASAPSAGRTG